MGSSEGIIAGSFIVFFELSKILFGNLNGQGFIYTLLFGLMIFFIYLVFSFIEDLTTFDYE